MNVTQCDVCGNVVKHEQSVYVVVDKVKSDDTLGALIVRAEVCPTCWDKLSKILMPNGGK